MLRPQVRFLNVQPYGDKFLITDPYGVSETVVASGELLFLMSLMDGTRDFSEIAVIFKERTGIEISREEFEQVISLLERNAMLMNQTFRNKLDEIREAMLRKGIREPSHAGIAYPDEPRELRNFLDSSIKKEKTLPNDPIGILVPHMDMRVAIDTYGRVYSTVEWRPELVIILGVSHYVHETPFSVCPLDIDTPIGTLKTDKEVAEKLSGMFEYDILHDLLAYRNEHSIEFQAVFVKHLFPEAKVLPAIVSYGDKDTLKSVAKKIAMSIGDKKALIVSSVDMSHVGRKFGDPQSYDPSDRDKEYISLLSEMKGEEAFELLEKDSNRTRIDGQFTNLVFIELLKELGVSKGREIDYQVYREESTDSIVSYAGMSFS